MAHDLPDGVLVKYGLIHPPPFQNKYARNFELPHPQRKRAGDIICLTQAVIVHKVSSQ